MVDIKKKPIKCECGKMISKPKSNKSGLCSRCSIKKADRDRKSSP